MANVPKHVAAN